jgi:membrane-associated phospholipid phosphatase
MYAMYNSFFPLLSFIHDLDNAYAIIGIVFVATLAVAQVRREYGLGLFLSVALTFVVTNTLKNIFAIPRPEDMVLDATGYRFPSLHAAIGTAILLSLALYGARYVRTTSFPDWLAWAIWCGAFLGIVLIDISRVALNVHKPIDVVVGSLIGGGIAYAMYHFIVQKAS